MIDPYRSTVRVDVKKVAMYELRVRSDNFGEWAVLQWNDRGCLSIVSSHGNWSNLWPCIGCDSMAEFLSDINCSYMAGKMLDAKTRNEFDLEETARGIRSNILECRRCSIIDKECARDEWDLADLLDIGRISFEVWMTQTSFDSPYEYASTVINRDFAMFWDRIWVPHIAPKLKEIASNE